jgi:glycosyltransferase involved in cell wall biosynthesis
MTPQASPAMKIAVFHPGTQHSWQTALALQQLDRLAWYATSIFYQPERWPYRLERWLPGAAGARLSREFQRFSHPRLDPALVHTSGLAEWAERLAARAGWRALAQRIDHFGNRCFVRQIAQELRAPQPFAVWGYNGSALSTFELARERGRRCILDRTIGDFRVYNALMGQVAERYGEWFRPGEGQISPAQIARDEREFALADAIVVGCAHAAETIRQCNPPEIAAKLRVLPYCFDEGLFADMPAPAPIAPDEPVRLLFVGQVNPRKGIQHLLEAIARIPPSLATLTIVGELRVPRAVFARYADRVSYRPTVPRSAIPGIMAQHHLLVFPSYFEGSALSLLEALAAGLAIIQTPAAGNGVTPATGLMLARPDTELLQAALLDAISDRARLQSWRIAAQTEARRYSFARYRENIATLLSGLGI